MGNFLKKTLLAHESVRELPERFRDNPFYPEQLLSDDSSVAEIPEFNQRRPAQCDGLVHIKRNINVKSDLFPNTCSTVLLDTVDCAVKEILTVGRQRRQARNAQKMSIDLRQLKKKDERLILEYCVKLYTQSSFLYRACHRDLNDYYASDDNQLFNYRKLLQSYIDIYGKSYIGEIYRGAVLSEMQIKLHLTKDLDTTWYSPTFLSTSKSRQIAEIFGNVLMIINIQESDDNKRKAVDISHLSAVPDEEEVLLTPKYTLFKMKQAEFNPILEKIIIYLSSTRSSVSSIIHNDQHAYRTNKCQPTHKDLERVTCSFTWPLYLQRTDNSDSNSEDELEIA
jgi:hypothetical protein